MIGTFYFTTQKGVTTSKSKKLYFLSFFFKKTFAIILMGARYRASLVCPYEAARPIKNQPNYEREKPVVVILTTVIRVECPLDCGQQTLHLLI